MPDLKGILSITKSSISKYFLVRTYSLMSEINASYYETVIELTTRLITSRHKNFIQTIFFCKAKKLQIIRNNK